ncbi:MAG TPA: hypothetical protein VG225_16915 [Terracidiphilus sp.]|jgi:hypothetical protein|nr:hypothetical protein [Terracidiphilus sp.]
MLTCVLSAAPSNPADTGLFTDAITAAILAAFASLLGLLISKESKISEFRQRWIDELRKDISWVLGEATVIHAGLVGVGPPKSSGEINQRLARIRLRLNLKEKDHRELLKSLADLKDLIIQQQPVQIIDLMAVEVAEIAAKVLKREWNVVKKGELVFRATFFLLIAAITGFLYAATVHYFHRTIFLKPF